VETGNPVALVRVPELGVPKAPLNVTNAPADPTFTPNAVATPVPNAVIPVPPLATAIVVPVHTPVVIVPNVVMDDCPTYDADMSITGVAPPVDVILLLVPLTLVTVPVVVDKVPLVGKVTFVAPVIVNVEANAPDVVSDPPNVSTLVPSVNPAKVGELLVAID
jgi:hypothetical protein